jgi:heptosyltransferase-2
VAPNWIGDALMAQPLLARLHEKRPGLMLDALAPPWVAPVLRHMPQVADVIEAPFRHGALQLRERWTLGRTLRAKGYDQAIVLPNTLKATLVPFFADIPVRSGYVGEARYGLLNLTYKRQKGVSMPLHYARLSEAPGKSPAEPLPRPVLSISPERVKATLARFNIVAPYAVLCPGAEFGAAKRWPYFDGLAKESRLPVVLLGSGNDAAACAGIEGLNLAGKTTLEDAIDILAGAEHVVSNDSGLMHVAAALGKPQVALFGSSSPEHTPPLSPAARVLWLHIECSPCYQRECPLGHFRCLKEIGVDRVLTEIGELEKQP